MPLGSRTLVPIAAALAVAATPRAQAKARPARPGARAPASFAGLQPQPGAPLSVARVAVRPLDGTGTVRSVTTQRAYLDAGARDGLAAGEVLSLSRRGRPAGSCTVEAVTERNATCLGAGLRPGDAFTANPQAAGSLPARLPPRPSREEQLTRLAAVRAVAFVPLQHKGKAAPAPIEPPRRAAVGLAHFSWSAVESAARQQERVYAAVRGAEAFAGARLDLDLTGVYRPDAARESFSPGKETLVWLREASLAWGDPQSRFRLAAGRVLPWAVPGGPTFDGLQAGWHPYPGGEVGLFGGAVPNAVTTEPGLDRATAGAYWSWEAVAGKSLFRQEARLAWLRLAGGETRMEAEATAQTWVARELDVSAQARFGFGDYAAPGKLDSARIDLGWQRPGLFSIAGGFRYDESRVPDVVLPALLSGRTRHAWGAATFEGLAWLRARLAAAFSRDLVTREERTWAGPELVAPRLFGSLGGLAAGYAEELGSQTGRSAWLQGDLAPFARARLLARASWFLDHRPSPLPAEQIFGVLLSGALDVSPWLRIRLSALGRYALPMNESSPGDWGGSGFVSLEATP